MTTVDYFLKRIAPELLSRPLMQPFNQLMFRLAISGMGANNYDGANRDEERFLRKLKLGPRSLILDVGANEGQWATIARKSFPDAIIHSFEPNPVTFNRLKSKNLGIAVPMGCADKLGTLTLYDSSPDAGSGLASFVPGVIAGAEIQAQVTTLDDYCRDLGDIGLLKIDVEGYEAKVLAGGQEMLKRTHVVQLEFNEMNLASHTNFNEIATLLPGFRLHRLLYNGDLLSLADAPDYRRNLFVYQNIVAVRS